MSFTFSKSNTHPFLHGRPNVLAAPLTLLLISSQRIDDGLGFSVQLFQGRHKIVAGALSTDIKAQAYVQRYTRTRTMNTTDSASR